METNFLFCTLFFYVSLLTISLDDSASFPSTNCPSHAVSTRFAAGWGRLQWALLQEAPLTSSARGAPARWPVGGASNSVAESTQLESFWKGIQLSVSKVFKLFFTSFEWRYEDSEKPFEFIILYRTSHGLLNMY